MLVRSPQSLELIEKMYREPVGKSENMKLVSNFLRPSQKALIDGLAEQTGKGKAAVMREIIDEWCETQLKTRGIANR